MMMDKYRFIQHNVLSVKTDIYDEVKDVFLTLELGMFN